MMDRILQLGCGLLLMPLLAAAQLCTADARFTEQPYFTDADIGQQSNVTYGTALDWQGNPVTCRLDAYYPMLAIDPLPLRPVIMMVHGGGLISGDKANYTRVCREFAKRGFVALSINYRLGLDCGIDTISEEKAKYRAQQDVHAALRFVVENAAALRIDTAWMFLGGGSAGSVAALGVLYISQQEWDTFTPSLQPLLGPLTTSGNTLVHPFTIKGVFNDWGAMAKASMQPDELRPMVSFHGDADPTVDIDSSFGGGCIHVERSYGSRAMHQLLVQNGVCSELSVKPGGGHGVFQDSLIGVPFRVGRAACFFKSLFCADCTSFYQVDSAGAGCSLSTGLPNVHSPQAMRLFPQPVTDRFALSGSNGTEHYLLTDPMGRIVLSTRSAGPHDVSHLPAGMYMLHVSRADGTRLFRLLKD